MSEKTAEEIAAEEAARNSELDALKAKLEDAEKRAEDAKRKFEQTKAERAEERDKRQKEAEKNQQYEEAKKLADEKLAEMQGKIAEAEKKLAELEPLRTDAQQWQDYQNKRREELLLTLPEEEREKFKTAPLDLLETTVKLIGTQQEAGEHKGGAARAKNANGLKWSEMSDAQRSQKALELPVADLTKLISQG